MKIGKTDNQVRVLLIAIFILVPFISPLTAFAATFSLTPKTGYVKEGNTFVVDILIDTEGAKSNKAKAVITFDPTLVQLTKAERNNSLYSTYPVDEQTTDNKNGVVMLTGFTQSGSGTLYETDASADVYARLTFKAIKEGTVVIDWEYTGLDAPFKSVILTDGSPPQNSLAVKPTSASFIIQDDGSSTPVTGLRNSTSFIIAGVAILGAGLIFSGGGVIYNASRKVISTNKRTLVEYE